MKLRSIALVRTGLVLSRKEARSSDSTYEYRQLNLKSVDDTGTINIDDTVPYCTSEELPPNYLTQVGDIIVKTSEPYTAAYITDEYSGLVIPSHYVVVRVDDAKAIPQYIAWYLNKDRIKKAFRMSCTGTLKQIKPTTIAETEVNLPTLERQQKVVELNNISQREIKLLKRLLEQKEAYYKALINKVNRM
jgi:Restriction endonuclease S subunits